MKTILILCGVLIVAIYFSYHKVTDPYKDDAIKHEEKKATSSLLGDKGNQTKPFVYYQFKHRPVGSIPQSGSDGLVIDPVANSVIITCDDSMKEKLLERLKEQDVFLSRIGVHVVVVRIVCKVTDQVNLDVALSKFSSSLNLGSLISAGSFGVALTGVNAILSQESVKADTRTLLETDSIMTQGQKTSFSSTSEQQEANAVTTVTSVTQSSDLRQVGFFLYMTPYFLENQVSVSYDIRSDTPDTTTTVQTMEQSGELKIGSVPVVIASSRRYLHSSERDSFFWIPTGKQGEELIQQDIVIVRACDPAEEAILKAELP